MSLLHFNIISKRFRYSVGVAHINHKQRQESEHEGSAVIGQRNIRSLFTIVPSQESFQKNAARTFSL